MKKAAKISKCGRYRWWLSRLWDTKLPTATFVMLNPSTADAEVDDQTIRKCVGFAKRWGCGSIFVVNLFSIRSTKPEPLKFLSVREAVGSLGNKALIRALRTSKKTGGIVVVAWGHQPKSILRLRPLFVIGEAKKAGVILHCLGTTKTGQPKHPVMLSYDTKLRPLEW